MLNRAGYFWAMANTPLLGIRVPINIQRELRAVAASKGVSLSEFMREAALAALADQAISDQLSAADTSDA